MAPRTRLPRCRGLVLPSLAAALVVVACSDGGSSGGSSSLAQTAVDGPPGVF